MVEALHDEEDTALRRLGDLRRLWAWDIGVGLDMEGGGVESDRRRLNRKSGLQALSGVEIERVLAVEDMHARPVT